jgi:GNAT superfamily N-acetyltransferase
MAHHLATANTANRMALVAESQGEIVAVGRYEPSAEAGVVELAIVVTDAWQGRGLGRILLRETLGTAAQNGIRRFRADVLADNRRILHLLAEETKIEERKVQGGVITMLMSLR